jgi:dienelactone hydrolase
MNRRARILQLALATLILVAVRGAAAPEPRGSGLRERFLHSLDRPKVALEPRVIGAENRNGLVFERISVASEAGVRVPVLLVRDPAATGRRPAVVCLHGLGGNKNGMSSYLEQFAHRGFVGVALDARYHGDRAGDVQAAMIAAFKTGKEHPYLFDTVWDTWRVLDYLQTRPDVDPDRLGVMGISLGGHTTWMASADPRVKVAVPCISVCSWKWQLEHQGYVQRVKNLQRAFDGVKDAMGEKEITPKVVAAAWKQWMPGVPDTYDSPEILAAMAPRPLLMINGDSDPVAPLEGLQIADQVIEQAYRRAGVPDHVRLLLAKNSGHTVTAEQQKAIFEWFERWLKN